MDDSFGARLRYERERRQIALSSIAEGTKISISLLEGLERNDVSRWPSGIFRKSFLRSYLQAIGLDPEPMVREFVELYPDPLETVQAAPAASPGKVVVNVTVISAGAAFTKGKALGDIRKRWAAAACDAGVSCGIALCMFMVLGHFWTPLGVSMLCYYAGGIILLGNTPGVCLFAPGHTDQDPAKRQT